MGAYAVGVVEKIQEVTDRDYQLYVGNSTGSLMQLFTANKKFDELKEIYTSTNTKDILEIPAFNKKARAVPGLSLFFKALY